MPLVAHLSDIRVFCVEVYSADVVTPSVPHFGDSGVWDDITIVIANGRRMASRICER